MTKILELIIFPGCPILFVVLVVGEIVWKNFKLMRRINKIEKKTDIMVDVIDRNKGGYNPPPIGAKPPPPPTHSPFPVVLSVREVEEQAKEELQSVFAFAPKVLVKEKKYFRKIRPEVL